MAGWDKPDPTRKWILGIVMLAVFIAAYLCAKG
jgi:hypothetical protein